MAAFGNGRNPSSLLRFAGYLGTACVLIVAVVFGFSKQRQSARRNVERQQAELRQRAFDRVKQGNSRALVMDSKLLPMLASDNECIKNVTGLDFASTKIDTVDAQLVAHLHNVTSMTFYCTQGTEDVLLAARSLPIAEIDFEMPDLPDESYLILKEYPSLKRIHFEHVMDAPWIVRLKSEMPDVIVDAPFARAKDSGVAK